MHFSIYRFNPETDQEPYMQDYESGEIEPGRFENYLDLQKELKYLQSRQDDKMRKQIQARGKAIAKFSRQLKKDGKRGF